ncbi:MAG: M90 family metallopeptidase [Chitinophagaceae bacterium]
MTDAILTVLLLIGAVMVFSALASNARKRAKKTTTPFPGAYRLLLNDNVAFYNRLDSEGKINFENRVQHFLSTTRITGIRTTVEDIDRVLIGASAIIPIYAFPGWEYINLREVLLYPETFGENFEMEGGERVITGMVGNGPMQQVMILAQHALREGFSNKTDKANTAIHEFVHLVDKTDGDVDGVPEVLMQHHYVLPWLDLVHNNIKEIMKNRSDINPYGATSKPEFLAVAAEYFFERPDLLKRKHPELFSMLEKIFGKLN